MTDATTPAAPAVAWRPLLLLAAGTGLVMLGFSGRYGYHRDELYFLVAGRHPAWGYDDQGPVAPILARLMDTAFPGSVAGLRAPSALAVAAIALLVGLIARELEGTRAAQLLAAGVAAVTPVFIGSGHLLSTTILDILFWTLLSWLLARWMRTRHDRLLLVAGPVTGLALLNKPLVAFFVLGVLSGVLIAGPRDLLRRPALWLAAVVALAMCAPYLWWQASHGWPQLEMAEAIRDRIDLGGRVAVVPGQLLLLGPPVAAVAAAGLWRLFRPAGRPFRAFAWAYLVVLALTIATGGQDYYPAGAFGALIATGALATVAWWHRSRNRRMLVGAALAAGAVSTAAIVLPVYPVAWVADSPQAAIHYDSGETIGWPGLVDTVAEVYHGLSEPEQRSAVILTRNYGEAGAIDRYGGPLGLPSPYSGHNNYWRWGPPPAAGPGMVIAVGTWPEADLARLCDSVHLAARHDNGYGLENEEQGVPVRVCGRSVEWTEVWPQLHRFS